MPLSIFNNEPRYHSKSGVPCDAVYNRECWECEREIAAGGSPVTQTDPFVTRQYVCTHCGEPFFTRYIFTSYSSHATSEEPFCATCSQALDNALDRELAPQQKTPRQRRQFGTKHARPYIIRCAQECGWEGTDRARVSQTLLKKQCPKCSGSINIHKMTK